jgi:gamma-glutamyltranspeptidase
MPGGSAPKKGEIFRNPYLAQTLELIARQGRDVFYKGEIAEKIVKYVREQGGFLSLKDFEDHRRNGSNRCRPATVATMFGNCRPTDRERPRCKC